MTETEYDELISVKMKESVADRRLSDDFQDRLVRSVKRARIVWRIRVASVIAAAIAIAVVLTELSLGNRPQERAEAMLLAAEAPVGTTEASGWFLLGYLREYIKRARNNKRKEEE